MMRSLRDIVVVAGHDLADSLRSRRVVILALLYVGGAVAGTYGFVQLLESLEEGLADTLAVARPDRPGAITQTLMQSDEFVRILTRLIKDRALAVELASLPPLSLFYGWLALTFCPVLVMITSSETIATELSTGSLRFSLVRTDRLSFSVGKFVGQLVLMSISLVAGACGVWITGYFALDFFEPGRTALWLLLLSARASVYGFAWVGLALGLSHLTRSIPLARAAGLLSLAAVGAAWGFGNSDWVQERTPVVADTLLTLVPRAHQLDLWRTGFAQRLPGLVMLLALGIAYLALGYAFRARRDA